ncbi:MAG TPA: hypothetical protein VFL79_13650, partial [Terriglobia bacterium]|nr:hypothetical protein [Terriglobia bacterium]
MARYLAKPHHSEYEMDSNLPVARLVFLVEDTTESTSTKAGSIVRVGRRSPEARVVQGVEEIASYFNVHTLLDPELF